MEVSFLDLREREIVNVYDGKKLGRIVDVVFNNASGVISGIVVPGNKKLFHRSDDVFIPLEKIKRIGNDVILVGVQQEENFRREKIKSNYDRNIRSYENSYEYINANKRKRNYYYDNNYYQNNSNSNARAKKNINTKNNRKDLESFVRLKPLERKKYK